MAQFRYEVWSVPGIATFEKKIAGLRPDSASGTLYRRQSGLGQFSIPADYDRLDEIITVDPSNHANDVASLIRVYRGSDLIQELLVPVSPNLVADQPAVLGCAGIEAVMDWAITECWDWDGSADFTSTVPDWIYGGRNLIPDLALGDLGSIREQWELWNDQTPGGTFVLRVTEPAGNPQDTNSLAFDATIQQIEGSNLTGNGLEGLSNVNDVTISGSGQSNDDPWVITFFDPPIISNLQVFDSGSLVSALSQTEAGRLDPSPVTVSQSIDASRNPNTHGTYTDPPIEVVTTPLDTGADWSLLVNATGQYAGSQIVLNGVTPGQIYQASIRVRPTITGLYTLVIHDQFENRIKTTTPRDNTLTAGSFQELSISDIEIPEGVTRVIMRVAVTDPTPANIGDYYVNWQGAVFREGQAATTAGQVLIDLLDDAQTNHASGGFPRSTIDFINAGFTAALDTAGAAWADSELSINIPRGMTYRKILDRVFGQLGYEWNLTPTAGTPGEWDLNVWNPDGRGTDWSAADTPSLLLGQGTLGGSATRQIPSANRVMSEGAGQFTTRARNVASEGTIGSREWYQADVSYRGVQAEDWTDKTLARFLDVSLQPRFEIADPPDTEWPIPVVDYGLADTLNVDLADGGGKVSRSVEAISWRTEADGIRWGVHTGEAQFDAFPTGGGISPPLGLGGGESRGAAAVAPQRASVAVSGPVSEGVRRLLDEFDRQQRPQVASAFVPSSGGGQFTISIAASNASEESKGKADFIAPGTAAGDTALFNQVSDMINVGSGPNGQGRVNLSEGTFTINDTIDTTSGTWQGTGPHSTIINGSGLSVFSAILNPSRVGSVISDMSILGAGVGVGMDGNYSQISNCYIATTGNWAIEVNAEGCDISGCRFESPSGVHVAGSNTSIRDCTFTNDNNATAIDIDASSFIEDILVSGCQFNSSNSGDIGIDIGQAAGGKAQHVVIRDCIWLSGAVTNIRIVRSNHVYVINNTFWDQGDYDISMDGCGPVVISGNTMYTSVEVARIYATAANRLASIGGELLIVGNQLGPGAGEGIRVESSDSVRIVDNDLREIGEHGIVFDGVTNGVIAGNRVDQAGRTTDNTYDGILLEGNTDRAYLHGNYVLPSTSANDTRYAVNVSASTCDCNVIVGNVLSDPADYGTDATNDAGIDTQWKYPDDPVYGDNFTDCEPTPS